MAGRPVSIGLVQTGSKPLDVIGNRNLLAERAEDAFREGASIVILPEMAATGYTTNRNELAKVAERVEGATTADWADIAARYDGYIVGGFCEEHNGELFNTAVIVGAGGVVLHYRKLHLFGDEKRAFSKGNLGLPIVRTPFGILGLCVCYDLRFVEVARALSLMDVEMLCVPTAWLAGFDTIGWDEGGMCPQAHGAVLQANLNQVIIACASQVGRHGDHEFLGSSVIAGPYGELAVGPMSRNEEQMAVVTMDLDTVKAARNRSSLITPRNDRRTDVYGLAVEGKIL